jgi:hypothetical protein
LDKRKIVLIGSGNIGRRYLEGIAKIKNKLDIIVVDPDVKSHELAKHQWFKAGGEESCHQIKYVKKLETNNLIVELVIIATNSFNRIKVITEVALKTKPNYWILEKLLVQCKDDLEIVKLQTVNAKNVWVNISRRSMIWFQQLKKQFYGRGHLQCTLNGGLWEMACCAIHYIDLITFWTGEFVTFIDNKGLDKSWLKSKRPGFFEITGELIVKFSGGSELILQSHNHVSQNILSVKLENNDVWLIDEIKGTATSSRGYILNGRLEYQSEIAETVIKKILIKGTCELPTLKESSKQHAIFLDIMLEHWNYSNNCNDKLVPIT